MRKRIALTLADVSAPVGGLSAPSKMPWFGWSTPAAACHVGGRLRDVPGSTCHGCYAHRGRYTTPTVRNATKRRLAALTADPQGWEDGMVRAITALAMLFAPSDGDRQPAFRWHDSGDLQGAWHLQRIASVARRTRRVRLGDGTRADVLHWLPTREYGMVAEFFDEGGRLPRNLNVRLSAHMVDGPPPDKLAGRHGLTVSTVHTGPAAYPDAHLCPSRSRGNRCGDCRACWSRDVPHVSYPKH